MKCPYCAEEIQDDAIFCRYCAAMKENDLWVPANQQAPKTETGPKGPRFTMRLAGFFFLLSALAELVSIISPVQLFGNEYGGFLAVLYHLIYIGIYAGMGLALWMAPNWGLKMILYGSLVYTVDRVIYMIYGKASSSLLSQYGELMGAGGQDLISQATVLTVVATLATWWGFVGYVYVKRDYFESPQS